MLLHHQLSMRVPLSTTDRTVHLPVRKRVACRTRDLHQSLLVKLSRAQARVQQQLQPQQPGHLQAPSPARPAPRDSSLDLVRKYPMTHGSRLYTDVHHLSADVCNKRAMPWRVTEPPASSSTPICSFFVASCMP